MSGDFERELTKRVWTDNAFAVQAESDPVEALKSIGVEVPAGIKLKVVVQRRDTVYFSIPPVRDPQSPPPATPLNQMDLWSSKGLFIWLVPIAAKFKLLALRNAAVRRAFGTRLRAKSRPGRTVTVRVRFADLHSWPLTFSLIFRRGRQMMDERNAEWYRAQAAKCSELAEKATDPRIKMFNQAEADRWLRLAELAEKMKP